MNEIRSRKAFLLVYCKGLRSHCQSCFCAPLHTKLFLDSFLTRRPTHWPKNMPTFLQPTIYRLSGYSLCAIYSTTYLEGWKQCGICLVLLFWGHLHSISRPHCWFRRLAWKVIILVGQSRGAWRQHLAQYFSFWVGGTSRKKDGGKMPFRIKATISALHYVNIIPIIEW